MTLASHAQDLPPASAPLATPASLSSAPLALASVLPAPSTHRPLPFPPATSVTHTAPPVSDRHTSTVPPVPQVSLRYPIFLLTTTQPPLLRVTETVRRVSTSPTRTPTSADPVTHRCVRPVRDRDQATV